MPFLEQNRSEKVKSIYRALKAKHPEYPAEIKARIAERKAKKSPESRKPPETGGPAHKAPLNYVRTPKGNYKQAMSPLVAPMIGAAILGTLGTTAGAGIGTAKGYLGYKPRGITGKSSKEMEHEHALNLLNEMDANEGPSAIRDLKKAYHRVSLSAAQEGRKRPNVAAALHALPAASLAGLAGAASGAAIGRVFNKRNP